MPQSDFTIEHVPGRFQARVEGHLCVADYVLRDGVMTMNHTEVHPTLEGRGIAGRLVAAAFEYARAEGLKINPVCSYVAAYMRRHPETADLRA